MNRLFGTLATYAGIALLFLGSIMTRLADVPVLLSAALVLCGIAPVVVGLKARSDLGSARNLVGTFVSMALAGIVLRNYGTGLWPVCAALAVGMAAWFAGAWLVWPLVVRLVDSLPAQPN